MCAYAVAKKAAIIFKMSVSFFETVSSKSGVSIKISLLPSRVNPFASWTESAVQDFKFIPIRRFE